MNNEQEKIVLIPAIQDDQTRLDIFITEHCENFSRSFVQSEIKKGNITVNQKLQKASYKVLINDIIEVLQKQPQTIDLFAQDIPLDIVYQDSDIAVINKAQGMVVHPAVGNYSGTLVNALMFHLSDLSGISGEIRPGIVHRIDKNTSGLIVVAKNDNAHKSLSHQIKAHTAKRSYIAILEGTPKDWDGSINAPIARSQNDRKKMAVVFGGREAITHYKVIEQYKGFCLVRCNLETGRTHQIRVHMAHLHHPIVGDTVYGSSKPKLGLKAQALHAYKLEFVHPTTNEQVSFFAKPPKNFVDAVENLGGTIKL